MPLSLAERAQKTARGLGELGCKDAEVAEFVKLGPEELPRIRDGTKLDVTKTVADDLDKMFRAAGAREHVRRLISIGYSQKEIAAEAKCDESAIAKLKDRLEGGMKLENKVERAFSKLVEDRLRRLTEIMGGPFTWSVHREKCSAKEKQHMVDGWVANDFLRHELTNEEARETAATIIVSGGTTTNRAVQAGLRWISERSLTSGPFDITWFTCSTLAADTLRQFKKEHPHLSAATRLFLFPGMVDLETETVSGRVAAEFAEKLRLSFTYALLSSYTFDIRDGTAYYYSDDETRLQRACATFLAAHKFLFLDPSKFKREGAEGYKVHDLLETANAVTIYTVSSEKDEFLKQSFQALGDTLFGRDRDRRGSRSLEALKRLRLCIVRDDVVDPTERSGELVRPELRQ